MPIKGKTTKKRTCWLFSKNRSHWKKELDSVKNEQTARRFHRTNHLQVNVQRHLMGFSRKSARMRIKRQTRFDLCEKIFTGRWSFLGPGSEKKWYSTLESRPQGEWDRVAELMMIKFSESGHPVFRSTSPLSRGTLKSKRLWKIVDTLLCRPGND